jgi:hypothetical protein
MRGALQYPPPVLSYDELRQSLVKAGIIAADGLEMALAELICLGYLCEPIEGWYAFAVSDEELDRALAAEPVAEEVPA